MPQSVTSDQREDDKGRCIIHVSWNTLSSAVMEDVTHFNISINETAKIMEPYDSTRNLSLSAHMECSCGRHRVSMVAINRCGAMSRRTQNIVPDKKPMLTSLSECSTSTTRSPGDINSNKGNQTQSGSTRSCTEGYLCKFYDYRLINCSVTIILCLI